MGEDEREGWVDPQNNNCPYSSNRRDCDGDVQCYCISSTSHDCIYKSVVRDCDGTFVALCIK